MPSKTLVLFVTDRGQEADKAPEFRFGSKVVDVPIITCGIVDHDTDPMRKMGETYEGRFALEPDPFPIGQESCIDFVVGKLRERASGRILLFVHGFKNTFEDATRRAITTAHDIQFDGVTLTWSWPSDGSVTAYTSDEEVSQRTKRYFVPFMRALLARDEVRQLDVLAHSMGNRIALELLEALDATRDRQRIGSVVFAAPDVDKPNFRDVIRKMDRQPTIAYHRTMYAAQYDRALQASAWLHGNNRVGQGGEKLITVFNGVESVDASDVEARKWKSLYTLSHAHVFDVPKAVEDMKMLLMQKKNAAERGLPGRTNQSGSYWVISK